MTTTIEDLPVVVIGAGPIGLAAAAHLQERDVEVRVLERGATSGAAVGEWGHVRLFSPWSELVDPAARRLLERGGWQAPRQTRYPTGQEWVDAYLRPLGEALGCVSTDADVVAVTREDRDRLVTSGRARSAFVVRVRRPDGVEVVRARAVVEASGTWTTPNPLGADGIPAIGEEVHADRILHRMPDLRDDRVRGRYAGRHVVVAGTGASAKGTLIALASLAEQHPATRVTWLVRRARIGAAFGGSGRDELSERGALGEQARRAVEQSAITPVLGFRAARVLAADGRLVVEGSDSRRIDEVDEIIALTGFRPDLSHLTELRLDLDPVLQAPRLLAPLIDPNEHSCGTVEPHGARELEQPEPGFYVAGMASYGRASSFLALTGFEQVRSVAAAIAGDHAAAAKVELALPDTGVCGGAGDFDAPQADGAGCCGTTPAVLDLRVSAPH